MRALVLSLLVCVGLTAAAFAEPQPPPPGPGQRIEVTKPSGFWGKGDRGPGAYRWKLLGIGAVILGATGIMMMRLVRRANAERASRAAP